MRRALTLIAAVLALWSLIGGEALPQLPTPDTLECPAPKRTDALQAEESSVLDHLGSLRELRGPGDLRRLDDIGFSFRPNQFTSIEGIGMTVANPVPLLQPGSPNVLFYLPHAGARTGSEPRHPDFPYTLAGWGYEAPYAPSHLPGFLPCMGADDWHVHERGIDSIGSGRTRVMAPSETEVGSSFGSLSAPPALQAVVGYPHPRSWSAHLWLGASGVPESAILDPADPAPGVDPGTGSNLYSLDEPPSGVLDATATGLPVGFQRGEGQTAKAGESTYTLKATAFGPGGAVSVIEATLPSGSTRIDSGQLGHDEGWYVVDGEIDFEADGQSLPARGGSFVYLPAGVDYGFEVEGGTAQAAYVTVSAGPGRRAEPKPYVLEPDEGTQADIRGSSYTIKAGSQDTGGAFTLIEGAVVSGGVPPPHIHHRETEAFYLLDGEMSFTVGGQYLPLEAGGTAVLPIGAPHSYTVDGDGTAKVVLVSAPGGLDEYFIALAQAEGQPLSAEQAAAFAVEPILPPGAAPPGG